MYSEIIKVSYFLAKVKILTIIISDKQSTIHRENELIMIEVHFFLFLLINVAITVGKDKLDKVSTKTSIGLIIEKIDIASNPKDLVIIILETIERPFANKPINKIFTSTTKRFFFFILLLIIENNLCKCYIRKAIVYLFIFIYKYSKLIESSLLNFSTKRALLEQRRKEICVDFSDIL